MKASSSIESLREDLRSYREEEKAQYLPKFFQAQPGGYGEGDRFIGVRVPNVRKVARNYRQLSLAEISWLLHSEFHEERFCGFVILISQFEKADVAERDQLFRFLEKHLDAANNWDLIDLIATKFVGPFLNNKERRKLKLWVRSKNIWLRRLAMVSCYYFIKQGDFADALELAEQLLNDHEDLIHKAVGWMLREVGQQDLTSLRQFLKSHAGQMPRTALRYAIEKLPALERKKWLNT